jgi:hypothetical protein
MTRLRYAVIYASRLTDAHIELVRASGVNSYPDSLKRSPTGVDPAMVIVEWDDFVAQQIPAAVAAIQEIIDEGVTIRNEFEMRAYLLDDTNPFYEEPV